MFRNILLTIALVTASPALAQEYPNTQTLGGQMQRIEEGQAPVPGAWNANMPRRPWLVEVPENDDATQGAPPMETPEMAAPAPMPRAPEVIDSTGGGAIPTEPLTVMTSNGINYVSGGVGEEEMAQLKALQPQYNLQILMSVASGPYISGVKLTLTDAKGAVILSVSDAGPYLYAAVPPGNYTLNAVNAPGETKTAKITVPAKGAARPHVVFKG